MKLKSVNWRESFAKVKCCICAGLLAVVVSWLNCIWLFCDPMDCSPSVSSVRGISQVKILERVAISLSRRASQPRDQTHVSCISRLVLYHWATREACAGLLLLFWNAPLYLFIFYFSLSFFNHLSFIYLFIFTLQYLQYWFCHISTWIHHGCTRVPHPEPPSHLPPHTIPLGHPSAPAPSFLYPASNLDWQFVSYMILYMFQCLTL